MQHRGSGHEPDHGGELAGRSVRARRLKLGLSQVDLAFRLGSSQSRVARLEVADATVSIDRLSRGMLALGASRREIGQVLAE